jgi:excisionase family DNA binding protein
MQNEVTDANFKLLTKSEMAQVLGVTIRTLEHYMYHGKLPFLRLGSRTVRFDLEMVMSHLKANK